MTIYSYVNANENWTINSVTGSNSSTTWTAGSAAGDNTVDMFHHHHGGKQLHGERHQQRGSRHAAVHHKFRHAHLGRSADRFLVPVTVQRNGAARSSLSIAIGEAHGRFMVENNPRLPV